MISLSDLSPAPGSERAARAASTPAAVRLMVTGHDGFVGQAMQAFLAAHEWQAHGRLLSWCPPQPGFEIRDEASIRRSLEHARPDWVLHLAAQSHVPTAWADPAGTLQVNAGGTATLLKVLADMKFAGRVLFVSSADIYGAVPDAQLPITEDREPAPRNPYASSKVAAEVICRQWGRTHGLDIVIARPFNHTGPGQRADFALPAFAREVAGIAAGRQAPKVLTGDLQVTRDFLDVRDVAAAYLALLAKGQGGHTYNVCAGREVLLHDALMQLLQLAGVQAEVTTDPSRLRPAEQRRVCGSHGKITASTGWQPTIALQDTLSDLLEHWNRELQQ